MKPSTNHRFRCETLNPQFSDRHWLLFWLNSQKCSNKKIKIDLTYSNNLRQKLESCEKEMTRVVVCGIVKFWFDVKSLFNMCAPPQRRIDIWIERIYRCVRFVSFDVSERWKWNDLPDDFNDNSLIHSRISCIFSFSALYSVIRRFWLNYLTLEVVEELQLIANYFRLSALQTRIISRTRCNLYRLHRTYLFPYLPFKRNRFACVSEFICTLTSKFDQLTNEKQEKTYHR